jgi:uncharacterized membrane protein
MKEIDDQQQPSTAEVLEEVRRRQEKRRIQSNETTAKLAITADRFVFWLSKHWLSVFNTLAFLYVGLPFLAPTLMHLGAEPMASFLYTIYSPLCHQLPQRSWFLFGPQIAYRLPELMELAGDQVTDAFSSGFVGNEALGYKVAICQRDVAIYGAIFLFGLLYGLLRRRWDVRPLPWWAYILLGLVPMGLDGGYQLLSYLLPVIFPGTSLEPYETTPLMRLITGALFGWATVWLAYPYVQESMEDVRASLEHRFGWA